MLWNIELNPTTDIRLQAIYFSKELPSFAILAKINESAAKCGSQPVDRTTTLLSGVAQITHLYIRHVVAFQNRR